MQFERPVTWRQIILQLVNPCGIVRPETRRGIAATAACGRDPVLDSTAVKTSLALLALAILLPLRLLAAEPGIPAEFAGVPIGATVAELRAHYPEAKRHPDSDREYQVYMVTAIKGSELSSAAAFSFSGAGMVGGQILITNGSSAKYWLEQAIAKYGHPNDCTYCDYPDMATASWRWQDGTAAKFDGSFALSLYTKDGQTAKEAWEKRGENAPEFASADPGEDLQKPPAARLPAAKTARKTTKHHPRAREKPQSPPPPSQWEKLYALTRDRIKSWFGY